MTIAVLLALTAYAVLSMGMVLMKKGIPWIGYKGSKDGAWRRDFRTWIAGFLLSNLYVVPSLMALKTLTPHIFAAFAGFGVVVLVLLAAAVLGEKLHRSDIFYTAAIFLSIILLNLYEPTPGKDALNIPLLAGVAVFPLLLFATAFTKGISPTVRAVRFASVSGRRLPPFALCLPLPVLLPDGVHRSPARLQDRNDDADGTRSIRFVHRLPGRLLRPCFRERDPARPDCGLSCDRPGGRGHLTEALKMKAWGTLRLEGLASGLRDPEPHQGGHKESC